MEKFIYVFDAAARDALSQAGFLLLKEDEANLMYVFAEDEQIDTAAILDGHGYIVSNILSFDQRGDGNEHTDDCSI